MYLHKIPRWVQDLSPLHLDTPSPVSKGYQHVYTWHSTRVVGNSLVIEGVIWTVVDVPWGYPVDRHENDSFFEGPIGSYNENSRMTCFAQRDIAFQREIGRDSDERGLATRLGDNWRR